MVKLKIKAKQQRIAYSPEEKMRLFDEGGCRAMVNVQKSKKVYNRKTKHKTDTFDI